MYDRLLWASPCRVEYNLFGTGWGHEIYCFPVWVIGSVQKITGYIELLKLEWQVFRDTESTEKSRILSTKRKRQKIAENTFFVTEKQKMPENHCLYRLFETKIHH